MLTSNSKVKAALKYQELGMSVIPVGQDKKPLIKWEQYQYCRASKEQINAWWRRFPAANVAVVTGTISGIVVIDIDKKHNRSSKEFDFPATACARSANDGEHIFLKYPGEAVKSGSAILGAGVDVRADAGYIIVDPSELSNGGKYEWIVPLEDGVADMPQWLLHKLAGPSSTQKWEKGINGVAEGERNETAASMAGKLLSSYSTKLWEPVGWESLKAWNHKCPKPLPEKELRTVWESIKKRAVKQLVDKKTKPSQADQIIELVTSDPNVTLFHDEFKTPFIRFQVDNHKEYWPCKSSEVRMWISMRFWQTHGKSASNDAISTALNTLQAIAKYQGAEYTLSNRVALKDNDLYYSLSNKNWENVHITEDGWSVENDASKFFRRYTHQAPQVYPAKGGDVKDILRFINIKNEEHQALFIISLVCFFMPGIPHPALYFYGPQGAAKSTTSRLIKKIIDPSLVEVSEIPKDQNDLIMKLSHNWCLMFDNVSSIPSTLSDILCRAITGSGFSKRELYSDDSDVIYNFQRCISINGINLLALKPDLLERSILIGLDRITKKDRKSEQELLRDFDSALPGILGGIMDTLSLALSIKPTIRLTETPRMADYTTWGYAIAEALGYGGDTFLKYYNRNIDLQHEEVIGESVVASFVVDFMEERMHWEGSATELLDEISTDPVYVKRDDELPKNPQSLSRMLNEIKTNLEECGIIIEFVSGRRRKVVIRKVSESTAPSATPSQNTLIGENKHEDRKE